MPANPQPKPPFPYPAGYLGEIDLFSHVTADSSQVTTAKPFGRPLANLPVGGFEAEVPATIARALVIQDINKRSGPVFILWDQTTGALVEVDGPQSAVLAAEIRTSLQPTGLKV